MACRLLALLLTLCAGNFSLAQDTAYYGEWYITFNAGHRQYRGTDCLIKIEQKEEYYVVTHLKDNCAECLPNEGSYIKDKDGNLVRGNLKLSFKNNRITYYKGGLVELTSMKYLEETQKIFLTGMDYMNRTDSMENSSEKLEYLRKCIGYMHKALANDEHCVECYYNISIAWYRANNMDSALANEKMAARLDPDYSNLPQLLSSIANYYTRDAWNTYGKNDKFKEAINELKKALYIDSTNADTWYNLGGAYYSDQQYKKAIESFKKCLALDPFQDKAKEGLEAAEQSVKSK